MREGTRFFATSESIILEEETHIVRLGMYSSYIGFTPALLYSSWQVLFTSNSGALCVFRLVTTRELVKPVPSVF